MSYTFKGIGFPDKETAMKWDENNRKVLDALNGELNAMLQKAKALDSKDIPDSKKNITINEMEISIRHKNLFNKMGITTIWELVHIDQNAMWKKNRYFRSRPRLAELIDTLNKAIALLTDTTNPEESK